MITIGPEGSRVITEAMCEAFMRGYENKPITVTELCAMPDHVREAYQMGVDLMRKENLQ